MNKLYGSQILISESTYVALYDPALYIEEILKVEYYFPLLAMSGFDVVHSEDGHDVPAELVYVSIELDNEIVYSNKPQDSGNMVMNGPIGALFELYTIESTKPLLDQEGVEVGYRR